MNTRLFAIVVFAVLVPLALFMWLMNGRPPAPSAPPAFAPTVVNAPAVPTSSPTAGLEPGANIPEHQLPPLEQVEADGYYGFQLRYRSYPDIFEAIQGQGFPAGLEGIDTIENYNRLRVKGTTQAVTAIRRRIAMLDGKTSSRRVVHHIRLQDIFASPEQLEKAGLTRDTLESGLNQESAPKITKQIQDAVRRGLLRATPGRSLTVEDGHEVSLERERPVMCKGPEYWRPRPVPRANRMSLTLTPKMEQPGQIVFTYEQGVTALGASNSPEPEDMGGSSQSAWAWSRPGETVLLTSLMEENLTERLPGPGMKFRVRGIRHLVLATTRTEGLGNTPLKPHEGDADQIYAVISAIEAPAASWRKHGLDPDLPAPIVSPFNLGITDVLEGAREVDIAGSSVDIYPDRTTPILNAARAAPGQPPLYTVLKFRGQRRSPDTAEVWIDMQDVAPRGARLPAGALPLRTFHGTGGGLAPYTIAMAARKTPGPGDIRRVTFVVLTVPYQG